MELTGGHLIDAKWHPRTGKGFPALDPQTRQSLDPIFAEGTSSEVASALAVAERDFSEYRQCGRKRRAEFLQTIAAELEALRPSLVERAGLETALPQARLEGELTRTTNQLRLFAQLLESPDYLQTRRDPALPGREPLPRPELRMTHLPLGPVVVFGASNFPLAFSVAGGDTAAALAAGCPVVVKGHPAHPGTCELAARAILAAQQKCRLPSGVFALLQGSTKELGAALVQAPQARAVAFTGSLSGGRALFDLAAARPVPIPVFAEMGSINPVFLLPRALQERSVQIAEDFIASVCLGGGQFCTKPGILFLLKSPQSEAFEKQLLVELSGRAPATLLNPGIQTAYLAALADLRNSDGVELLFLPEQNEAPGCQVPPALLKTTADAWQAQPRLQEEIFGPVTLVVECEDFAQMRQAAAALSGQLTATLHATEDEEEQSAQLLRQLELSAGRLILNGYPTGVEVCSAMVHGGPYPATTDSRFTSVGSTSIQRFLRPVCYQNVPAALLPEELRNDARI